jgi:hypothetical protein
VELDVVLTLAGGVVDAVDLKGVSGASGKKQSRDAPDVDEGVLLTRNADLAEDDRSVSGRSGTDLEEGKVDAAFQGEERKRRTSTRSSSRFQLVSSSSLDPATLANIRSSCLSQW